jgi:hypothetical protein
MRNRNLPEGDISVWYHDITWIATEVLRGVAMPEEPSQSRSF